jgi:hypothetical protein
LQSDYMGKRRKKGNGKRRGVTISTTRKTLVIV